ncbi:MAG TPA: BCCT family transporter [Anaerovoracaceae bacterium]|nr:BCCT family transporter [Anaerovoracaceae bacterium]
MKNKKIIKLKNELHEKNFTKFGLDLNLTVSILSAVILIAFILYSFFNIEVASARINEFKDLILSNFDNVFVFAANFFIVTLIILAISKAGKIRLGGEDERPQYSNFGWYAMLISAGMGIGLMFWAVGEPINHSDYTPLFESSNGHYSGLATTFFHWGVHPWAIYAIVALALAYFTFNRHLPLSPRSFFYPILKDKIFGLFGDIIDTLSVLAALAGLATSLGLGVQQINSGLTHLFNLPYSVNLQVLLITVITLIATISVVSGIDKGVKFLSKINIRIAGILMLIIFIIGPTSIILKEMFMSTGVYLKGFVENSIFVTDKDSSWAQSWTIFYWAWWISWSPFVGMFIAKISKGRTIREFITAVVIVPTVLSIIWMSVFGSTAIYINEITEGVLGEVVNSNVSIALFEMVELISAPFVVSAVKTIINIIGVLLVTTFFVTSSDSGSLVVDSLASGGKIHSPVAQRVFWALMEGLIAATLLVIGGEEALSVLQTAVITTGLPFAIILTLVAVILLWTLVIKSKNVDVEDKKASKM